jgi:GTP pyrophosphokinase
MIKSDLDLFSENVYCFSPAGDVKQLPYGSCPVDFAYSIHSAVGNRMVGARVNGRLVPIEYQLKNGDRVEILTSQNSKGPSRDWLKIVKSSQAKTKINQWFRAELKNDNIERGKEMISQAAKQKGYAMSDLLKQEYMDGVLQKYGFRDWDSVLAAIGHGGLKENQVVNKLVDQFEKENKKKETDEEILKAAGKCGAAHKAYGLITLVDSFVHGYNKLS